VVDAAVVSALFPLHQLSSGNWMDSIYLFIELQKVFFSRQKSVMLSANADS
jgi:hypothetical protein